jgi:hypothetical protein
MIIVVAVMLALGAMFYTLFVRQQDIPEPIPVSPIQHLEDRKRAIYDNLRDLQFEYRLGKLSDEDYQQTKLALQRELAGVLAETEETVKRLGGSTVRVEAKPKRSKAAAAPKGTVCPHCGAKFPQPLKFCGECGKAMS